MDMDRAAPREVFRRSWLTTAPDWAVGSAVSLAVGLAALHLGTEPTWEAAALVALPLIWAAWRNLQWACQTCTVRTDGRLVESRGVLFPIRQVIDLSTVTQVTTRVPGAASWLNVGHIAFYANGENSQRSHFRWTWMAGHRRLCEIMHAGGQLPVGRPAGREIARQQAQPRLQATISTPVRAPVPPQLQDYGRFMAFCHRVLRAGRGGQWPPAGMPPEAVEACIAVLRQRHVVVDSADERGWCVARDVAGLEDVHRRLGPVAWRRLVRQPARPRPR